MTIDCESVRRDFPELSRGRIIYLDNAASTLKPRQVIDEMKMFMEELYANVHRGVYPLSAEATRIYEEAHSTVADLICARPEEIVFTPQGTTNALHLAALLIYNNRLIGEGDEIIVPGDAHNSNLLPWVQIAKWSRASVRILPVGEDGTPEWHRLGELISKKTRIVAVTHVSNVTGYESPVNEISKIAREVGALVVVDAAQSVPHQPICINRLDVDFLAFSGHKMLGPTGIGVLWIRRDLAVNLEPPLAGGGTVRDVNYDHKDKLVRVEWDEPPWRFEAGTPPIVEAVGLAAAARYLMEKGLDNIAAHESSLTRQLLDGLSSLEGIRVIGPRDPGMRRGIVSFVVKGMNPDLTALRLGQEGIAVRSGTHCANLLHHMLGVDEGSVRASFYLYNCPWEIESLLSKLSQMLNER